MGNVGEQNSMEIVEQLIEEGALCLQQGRYDRAIALFRKGLQIAPLRQDLREYLTLALDQRPDADNGFIPDDSTGADAKEDSKDAADWPDDVDPLIESLAAKSGRRPESSHALEQLTEQTGVEHTRRGSHIKLPMWLLVLAVIVNIGLVGLLYVWYQHSDSFDEWMTRLRNLNVPENVQEGRRLYELALDRVRHEDYEGALTYLQDAARIHPEEQQMYRAQESEIYLQLAHVELDLREDSEEKYNKALELFQKSADLNSQNADAWFNIGYCKYSLARKARLKNLSHREIRGIEEAAAEALEHARKVEPNHQMSIFLLAKVYPKIPQMAKAADVWYTIIEQWPESPEARQAERDLKNFGLPLKRPQAPESNG